MAPHSRKNLDDIMLEDIDFEVLKVCTCKDVVKRYIKLLVDDGSHFHELMQACKEKLLELDPKAYYLMYPRQTTAKEVDDITKDLLEWEETVRDTDAALRASRKQKIWDDVPGVGVTAPIRGQEVAATSRPNTHRKEEIQDQENKQKGEHDKYARDKTKMKDYYRDWEKVDVDKIEEEMDAEEAAAEAARQKHFSEVRDDQEESNKYVPVKTGNLPEGVPEAHRRHMADSEKEKGNEAFYAKDYEEAEAYYSRSLHFRADDPSCWANRGLSRLKLDNPQGALQDCDHALAINAKYMKALHRKGKALYELNRFEEAVQCFQLALMESPGNTQINGDLMVARRKLRSDGPVGAPPQPKTFAPPSRTLGPRGDQSSCVIEEVFDDEEEGEDIICDAAPAAASAPAAPAAGYTRVAIEEDSDSEEEEEAPSSKQAGFHKVQIQEASDSEEDGEPEREPTAVTAVGAGFHKVQIVDASDSEEEEEVATAGAGFHKVQIVEGSDSEEEEESPKTASAHVQSATSAPEEELCFEDMD